MATDRTSATSPAFDASRPLREAIAHRQIYATGKDGQRYVMRPIEPGDAPSLIRGYAAMSTEDKWFRMLSGMPHLPPDRAQAYCAPDQTTEYCVVLEGRGALEGEILGGARAAGIGPGKVAEFSVSLRPEAQGLGLARQALDAVVQIAEDAGCAEVWGYISARNGPMIALARRCGFDIRRDRDDASLVVATRIAKR